MSDGIIHIIASNIHIILEKRLIQFIHSALNSNEICKQILCVKLRCKSHRLQKVIDTYLGIITLVIVIGLQISHISWAK